MFKRRPCLHNYVKLDHLHIRTFLRALWLEIPAPDIHLGSHKSRATSGTAFVSVQEFSSCSFQFSLWIWESTLSLIKMVVFVTLIYNLVADNVVKIIQFTVM